MRTFLKIWDRNYSAPVSRMPLKSSRLTLEGNGTNVLFLVRSLVNLLGALRTCVTI